MTGRSMSRAGTATRVATRLAGAVADGRRVAEGATEGEGEAETLGATLAATVRGEVDGATVSLGRLTSPAVTTATPAPTSTPGSRRVRVTPPRPSIGPGP